MAKEQGRFPPGELIRAQTKTEKVPIMNSVVIRNNPISCVSTNPLNAYFRQQCLTFKKPL